jgi:hypothetical protein
MLWRFMLTLVQSMRSIAVPAILRNRLPDIRHKSGRHRDTNRKTPALSRPPRRTELRERKSLPRLKFMERTDDESARLGRHRGR